MTEVIEKLIDKFPELREEWEELVSELGKEMRNLDNTYAIDKLARLAELAGVTEKAQMYKEYVELSSTGWSDELFDTFGVKVYYDEKAHRWRDEATGRFIPTPKGFYRNEEVYSAQLNDWYARYLSAIS